ncbi:MAG: glycosyltransferase family 2 protein [Acidobacteriota bacterium]|nr:glycosyltransferase family 2 protein [Blastocatellia bacterium]MDW8240523.1 glycosyltransferase family 2 protein [Acidobacteriota bacterium]
MTSSVHRVLVAIPAYNEQATIGAVVRRVQEALPEFDLLVVNDGSQDQTEAIVRSLGVDTATHLCNLGYGRAVQTAIKHALRNGYDTLITLDADGQHRPEQIRRMFEAFVNDGWDYLVGSRYVQAHDYRGAPLGRRVGMQLFSWLTKLFVGQRIYDTTSGLKIMRRTVFEPLTEWHFVDFHAEAIVYLWRLGFRIGEYPITVDERQHGQSMYSLVSHVAYPLKTSTMILLGTIQADLTRRKQR